MSNLYETLGLSHDATPDQIRKAYKKKALETHPDRFSTKPAEDKAFAEEEFRKVNNAYEVLNDPQKRKVYDQHGVWPPSEAFDAPPPGRNRRHTGQDPFFDFDSNFHGFHGMRGFGAGGSSVPPRNPFTDPFVLFNSMFGDLNRHMPEPFMHFDTFDPPRERRRPRRDPFERETMFGPGGPGPMPGPFSSSAGMGMFGGMGASGGAPQRFRAQSSFRASGGRYGWQRESRVTTTVNGVTQSTWTRVDSDGNEHITQTLPDGREIYTVNGIEQGLRRDTEERFIPPPPGDMQGEGIPPPPLITGPHHSPTGHNSHGFDGPYNSAAVYPDRDWDQDRDHGYSGERETKRRWWNRR
ncbi:hypothetical protein PILCRDRAFT_819773 [Piloderma croceum F 1598]|uniref:J domain-containing protein n=1 Tax=Piloderma croceum (strain F 1598) TaxID=765440 RepID=A0A0C3C033_PILCF|nr:hypothetical protein PILCRDRAFT_819773 [Piloderma croceum F 1598]